VVQLVRTSSIMRVVMISSPDWSENFLIFHITYDTYSEVTIEVSGSEPTIIRRSALVQQVLPFTNWKCTWFRFRYVQSRYTFFIPRPISLKFDMNLTFCRLILKMYLIQVQVCPKNNFLIPRRIFTKFATNPTCTKYLISGGGTGYSYLL